MNKKQLTFISKYKPYFLKDFYMEDTLFSMIQKFIYIDYIQILFVGNSCSGKTSLLDAIVREYYELTSTQSFPEHNIMYVNNLKEQGIQYFRNEMKTFCQSHSIVKNKKKMVIIDDIDIINEQSQQVFRNYIDKYKHTIHFVFACTNLQKVNESIQSRIHIVELPNANTDQIQTIMNTISEKECLIIDRESQEYLLSIANGSIRLLINYLEKIFILNRPIDINLCKFLCSRISQHKFDVYIQYLREKNIKEAVLIMYEINDYGYSVIDILDYFFEYVKNTSLLIEDEKYNLIPYICKYISTFYNLHEHNIELSLFTNNIMKLL
jgi:DNA polymerase III delta prime subunit|uniref:ATPase AAA-type core domain-containing protein n=1 Tax=viral metagenome TaxID=1070528 RepID=A0A6C0IPY1_9ZZZZ